MALSDIAYLPQLRLNLKNRHKLMKLQRLRNISIEVFQMNVINKDDNMILIYYSMRGFFLGAKCFRFL